MDNLQAIPRSFNNWFEMTIRKRYSLRTSLLMVVAACIVPAVVISASLIYKQYQMRQEQLDQTTLLLARKVVADLDRELASIESALKILATSQNLALGNFKSFYQQARDALAPGIVYNFILTDPNGAQILNTLRPYGTTLPKAGTPPELQAVFSTRKTILTGLFIGPVTGTHLIAMGVPVLVGDEVKYSLNIGLAPSKINEILGKQAFADGWLIAVLDQNGTIVGRSRDAARFIGQKPVPEIFAAIQHRQEGKLKTMTKEEIPVVASFSKSDIWHWTVVIGAPDSSLHDDLSSTIAAVIVATALAIALGVSVALSLASRILSSVRGLNKAAAKLGDGTPIELPAILLKEADAVGEAIVKAANSIEEVKFLAQHDSLTGLANRRFFDQFAVQQLALAKRHNSHFAVIAIDLDGFKQVNDQHGHQVGDEVLKIAAERLTNAIRSSDVASRIGGDEFLILLCDGESALAIETALRIVDILAKPYPGVQPPVSASAGLAIYPQHGETLIKIISQADHALYRAKAKGKNRAELATPNPDSASSA